MDPKKLFVDERLRGRCTYCGEIADSRDHVPSKALLDKPYPDNLSIAESCSKCNNSFSSDEEYLSCLIECVIHGTTKPTGMFREKIAKKLIERPAITARIESSKKFDSENNLVWQPEWSRVKNVVLKLAQGHLSHELGVMHLEEPKILDILPTPWMSADQVEKFNTLEESADVLFPEIGSRSFIALLSGKQTAYGAWNIVQDGRYRYSIGQSSGDWIKFVISEYLACRVVWE